MPLDDLVQVIETLQERIRNHGESLRQNETRTRMALIDPLLTALGWDVADPGLVTAEYDVSGRRADYALLGIGNIPAATVEAKRLNESLEPHRLQMLNYSNAAGIRFAGLTDGNRWEFYEIFKQGTLDERRILEADISRESSAHLALRFLSLWRSNLETGQPAHAEGSLFEGGSSEEANSNANSPNWPKVPPGDGWVRLSDLPSISKGMAPVAIWFPTGEERPCTYWWHVLAEVAEWLVRTEKLTDAKCPVKVAGVGAKRHIVHISPAHSDGSPFGHSHQLSNSFYMDKPGMNAGRRTKTLLQHCEVDAGAVWIKLN